MTAAKIFFIPLKKYKTVSPGISLEWLKYKKIIIIKITKPLPQLHNLKMMSLKPLSLFFSRVEYTHFVWIIGHNADGGIAHVS